MNRSPKLNAKFMSYSEIAKTFIQTNRYEEFSTFGNSILAGPRGCGKTTLMKMITPRGRKELIKNGKISKSSNLGFMGVYFPADDRWFGELKNAFPHPFEEKTESIQRVLINILACIAVLDTLEDQFDSAISDETDRQEEIAFCKKLMPALELNASPPFFQDIIESLSLLSTEITGLLVSKDFPELEIRISKMTSILRGRVTNLVQLLYTFLRTSRKIETKWALCFDEIELAPEWLQVEIFGQIRSTVSNFCIKTSFSPLLVGLAGSMAKQNDDFDFIPLWNSKLTDDDDFVLRVSSNYLKSRFPDTNITPRLLLDSKEESRNDPYEIGSEFFSMMIDLAEWDEAFKDFLVKRGVDPNKPVAENSSQRSTFFRKIRPIVEIRHALYKDGKKRSRKNTGYYHGFDTLVRMSEGNPRRLLIILRNLCSVIDSPPFRRKKSPILSRKKQNRVLENSSRIFREHLYNLPSSSIEISKYSWTLGQFIDHLGAFFSNKLLTDKISLDPPNSFKIVSHDYIQLMKPFIDKALISGAVVVKQDDINEIPVNIQDVEFRLSFLLAPTYSFFVRNGKSNTLQHILSKTDEITRARLNQIRIDFDP